MCRGLMVLLFLLSLVGVADANVPDPDNCSVMPCDLFMGILTCPYSATAAPPEVTHFVVTVLNMSGQPIVGAYVEILVYFPANHLSCPNAQPAGITDENGQVEFNLAMGGCTVDQTQTVGIVANGVPIRIYERLLSPDYSGEGDLMVGLLDFTYFGSAMVHSAAGCTDYFNDGATGLDDFSAFGECWGHSCSP